jgi:hypothetical protein
MYGNSFDSHIFSVSDFPNSDYAGTSNADWNILHVNQVGELADEIDTGC